jgi:ribonuclease P protein component
LTSSRGFRFQKQNRLLNAAAFGRVFKKASRSRDKFFTVLCCNNKEEIARLGLAVSKKQCRKANARNRIKRVVRETFRHHQHELCGLDLVVLNQPAAAMAKNSDMKLSLEHHFGRCSTTKRKTNKQGS